MDVTGGLAQQVSKLPAEMQPIIMAVMDRVAALEAQSAKDANAIADKLIAAILPEIQGARVEFSAAVQEMLVTVKRLNGAVVTTTVALGPEAQ